MKEKLLTQKEMEEAKQVLLNCLQKFDSKQEKVSEVLFNVYPDEMRAITKLIAKENCNVGLPNDNEVSEWFDLNISNDKEKPCSASSAIYKFRSWLKEREIGFADWIEERHFWKSTDTRFPQTLGRWTNAINGNVDVKQTFTTEELFKKYQNK